MQELYANRRSPIHCLDARVKFILTLAFIISLNLTPYRAWPAYILFLTITLSLSIISRLGVIILLKRALLALPFVLAAAPLLFTGKPPLTHIQFGQGLQFYVSLDGLQRFASIALKSWISIQSAILLAATTRFTDLMTALQQLRVPRLLVAIVSLMWRYLFVISEEVTRMIRARNCRSAVTSNKRPGGSIIWRAKVTGNMAGSLFLRSLERSDRVYKAMLSRGYSGEIAPCDSTPLSNNGVRLLFIGIVVLLALFALGLLTGG